MEEPITIIRYQTEDRGPMLRMALQEDRRGWNSVGMLPRHGLPTCGHLATGRKKNPVSLRHCDFSSFVLLVAKCTPVGYIALLFPH